MSEKSELLMALEADRNGDWDRAHRIVQENKSTDACWIHAYLHRVESDISNAAYWYRRAGRPEYRTSLQDEWQELYDMLVSSEEQKEDETS